MRKANAQILAPSGALSELDGKKHFVHIHRAEGQDHIEIVSPLANDALATGWAATALEPGVAFAAMQMTERAQRLVVPG